jgi:hypothetical protein
MLVACKVRGWGCVVTFQLTFMPKFSDRPRSNRSYMSKIKADWYGGTLLRLRGRFALLGTSDNHSVASNTLSRKNLLPLQSALGASSRLPTNLISQLGRNGVISELHLGVQRIRTNEANHLQIPCLCANIWSSKSRLSNLHREPWGRSSSGELGKGKVQDEFDVIMFPFNVQSSQPVLHHYFKPLSFPNQ